MDGGGRIPQPLTRSGQSEPAAAVQAAPRRACALRRANTRAIRISTRTGALGALGALERWVFRHAPTFWDFEPPRGAGMVAALLVILAGAGYGVVRGGHLAD